jgi:hypothetical protein
MHGCGTIVETEVKIYATNLAYPWCHLWSENENPVVKSVETYDESAQLYRAI